MSLPQTCPFCGAGANGMSGTWVTFRCHTMTQTVADHRQFQSRTCEKAERARLVVRVSELEVENKGLRDRFSDADTERNAAQAALKAAFARVAELETRTREAEESNANALARLSAAEATIELRRIENEAVRHQVWHAENVCDAMEKRVAELDARCRRLEDAGDAMAEWNMSERNLGRDPELAHKWQQAKEARP